MTVIVGALTKQGITIAADGETTYDWQKSYGTLPKLWTDAGFAFGACGSLRVGQVIEHFVEWPVYHGPEEDGEYVTFLIQRCVPAMRLGVEGHGVMDVEVTGGREEMEVAFLIAAGDQLAEISGDGGVLAEKCGRMAIGSGYAEALGYLGDAGPWTEKQVIEAARRAIKTAHGVGGDISVVNTETLEVRSA